MILRPNSIIKAKQAVHSAEKNDLSALLDFDDSTVPFRERIVALEKRLLELPQVEIPIEHHFGAGIYARTMLAPRGTAITGRIYKKPQMIIVSSGEVTVRSEEFNARVAGPHIYYSSVGSKRFIYCHTNVVWTNLIATDAKDVESAEREIYIDSYEDLDVFLGNNDIIVNGG